MINWLRTGVISLAIAGAYSLLLVMLRTPYLNQLFNNQLIFRPILVVHVNLSVLVWLLSITCAIWSIDQIKTPLDRIYVWSTFISMICMALGGFIPNTTAIMNNYIPIIENLWFIIGISLFGVTILCFAIHTLVCNIMYKPSPSNTRNTHIVIVQYTSATMFIGVWICFYLSYQQLLSLQKTTAVIMNIDYFYEMLFWSGGHLLQFVYTQIFMLVLLLLTEVINGKKMLYPNIYEMLFLLNFVLAIMLFFGHIRYDISDGEFKEFFTQHMIYTGGIIPTIFILLLLLELFLHRLSHKQQTKYAPAPAFIYASFIASVLLFMVGGSIGMIISGANVTIPAHYHGSIVGISIAFMGLTYLACSRDNKEDITLQHQQGQNIPAWTHGAKLQIYIITCGQILHILGLALAGGYGVMRKTPGETTLFINKIYLGILGGGGILAIIGGLMFVYICAKNLYTVDKC